MGGVEKRKPMLTYEDVTAFFLKSAVGLGLTTHPEYWNNGRSMEREFDCVCHFGSCEGAETRSSCTLSFSWSALDTALSLEGPVGVCDFFHEPDEHCPHLHTRDIPPLELELSYVLPLNGTGGDYSEATLLNMIQRLKLRASELSSRTIETRPGINMMLQESRLLAESLTMQQRVELPIWHPDGMSGLHDSPHNRSARFIHRSRSEAAAEDDDEENEVEVAADDPRPEDWLPQVMFDVCLDICQVLTTLDDITMPKYL